MENKNTNAAVYAFTCITVLGLWLVTVGMFANFVNIDVIIPVPGMDGMLNDSIALIDSSWKILDGASPLFLILSYMALIAGLVIVAVDATIKQKLQKKVKGLNYAGFAISVVGYALVIVSMVLTKNDVRDAMNKVFFELIQQSGQTGGMTNQQIELILNVMFRYNLGIGSIMAIIGGAVALIGSLLLIIPVFDPMNTKSATSSTGTGYKLTLPSEPTGGGLASVKPFDPNAGNDNNDTIA